MFAHTLEVARSSPNHTTTLEMQSNKNLPTLWIKKGVFTVTDVAAATIGYLKERCTWHKSTSTKLRYRFLSVGFGEIYRTLANVRYFASRLSFRLPKFDHHFLRIFSQMTTWDVLFAGWRLLEWGQTRSYGKKSEIPPPKMPPFDYQPTLYQVKMHSESRRIGYITVYIKRAIKNVQGGAWPLFDPSLARLLARVSGFCRGKYKSWGYLSWLPKAELIELEKKG